MILENNTLADVSF